MSSFNDYMTNNGNNNGLFSNNSNRSLKWLIYPLIRAAGAFVIIFSISIVLSTYLYYIYCPISLIKEPIYFDFSNNINNNNNNLDNSIILPVAKVALTSSEKQWNYLKRIDTNLNTNINTDEDLNQQISFLQAGRFYSFMMEFHLAKSDRNRDLAKFMVHLTLFDSSSEAVAESSRPVVLPWEHPSVSLLTSLTYLPFSLLGFTNTAAVTRVELINNYRESSPPTDYLVLKLSTIDADIESAYLSIIPETSGLSHLLYHYPISTIIVGVWILCLIQLTGLAIYGLVYYVTTYANQQEGVDADVPDGSNYSSADSDSNDNDGIGVGMAGGSGKGERTTMRSGISSPSGSMSMPIGANTGSDCSHEMIYDDNGDDVVLVPGSASIAGDSNDSHSNGSNSDTETQYTDTITDVSGSQFGMTLSNTGELRRRVFIESNSENEVK